MWGDPQIRSHVHAHKHTTKKTAPGSTNLILSKHPEMMGLSNKGVLTAICRRRDEMEHVWFALTATNLTPWNIVC